MTEVTPTFDVLDVLEETRAHVRGLALVLRLMCDNPNLPRPQRAYVDPVDLNARVHVRDESDWLAWILHFGGSPDTAVHETDVYLFTTHRWMSSDGELVVYYLERGVVS